VKAVSEQLGKGTSYMLFQEAGIKLAKKMQKFLPHLEMVRFCNSGTEATMFAIRAARAWAQKDKIAKIEGGYNGQHDYVLVSGVTGQRGGPPENPKPKADCAGIPQFVVDSTLPLPFNDIDATVSIIEKNSNELAAVILEPVMGFGGGTIPADKDYLLAIREITEKNNILLIYDEIVTGFRVCGLKGAVKHYGVVPDLACYGKVIGGGFPVGAFGGRQDIMEKTVSPLAEAEFKIFQSGTFTGNVISMTAGLACLEELEMKDYKVIDNLTERLSLGLEKIASERGISLRVNRLASTFYPHFNDQPVRNMRDRLLDDANLNRSFCMGLIANGVWLPPSHSGALSFSHSEEDIDQVINIAEKVFDQLKP
jgi:glutamate-1-semialdehyde 2,1-aminomutase